MTLDEDLCFCPDIYSLAHYLLYRIAIANIRWNLSKSPRTRPFMKSLSALKRM